MKTQDCYRTSLEDRKSCHLKTQTLILFMFDNRWQTLVLGLCNTRRTFPACHTLIFPGKQACTWTNLCICYQTVTTVISPLLTLQEHKCSWTNIILCTHDDKNLCVACYLAVIISLHGSNFRIGSPFRHLIRWRVEKTTHHDMPRWFIQPILW